MNKPRSIGHDTMPGLRRVEAIPISFATVFEASVSSSKA